MSVVIPIGCCVCGDPCGTVTFEQQPSNQKIAEIQTIYLCGVCGPLVALVPGWRFDTPPVAGVPWNRTSLTLESARSQVRGNLEAWLARKYATPIEAGSITLPADLESQARLSALYAAENGAVTYGGAQLSDTAGVADSNGIWQEMTMQQLFVTLLTYAAACKAIAQTYTIAAAQIAAAKDQETLSSISW